MESNHLPIGYRPIARPESFAGMDYPRTLRSGRYERPVLPIELLRLERVRRIELRWLDWQSSAQPMSHTRQTNWSGRRYSKSLPRVGTPARNSRKIVKELAGDPGFEPGISCGRRHYGANGLSRSQVPEKVKRGRPPSGHPLFPNPNVIPGSG
jgi:hypothetical protein